MEIKRTILVIEDQPNWQREMTRILEDGGFNVHVAAVYEEAVEAIETGHFELAVVDMSLIQGDAEDRKGAKIMEQLAKDEFRLPVICISGYLKPSEVGDLMREGLTDWFFDKNEELDEERFLNAVTDSISRTAEETQARWKQIQERLMDLFLTDIHESRPEGGES